MSNIKPIKINPELFKVSGSQNKNKTLKNKPLYPVKSNVLKKDLLARIKNHRSHKQNNSPLTNLDKNNNYDYSNDNEDNYTNNESSDNRQNIDTINTLTQKLDNIPITLESNPPNKKSIPINNDQDDDFLQSINFLKTLSNKKNNTIKRKISQDFPIQKQENLDNKPEYGCLKNGSLPTFRQIHNSTIKRDSNDITNSTIPKIKSNNKKIYSEMADIIYNTLENKMLGPKYSYENNGENLGKLPIKQFYNKVIIIVNRDNPLFQKTELDELVNLASGSVFMRQTRFRDVLYNQDYNFADFNKRNMTIILPDKSSDPVNPNFSMCQKFGCQFIAMAYQNYDANLEYYNAKFGDEGKAIILNSSG